MPMYEYVCSDCGKEFSIIEPISAHDPAKAVACVACGSGKVERRFTSVAVETSRKS